MPRPDRLLLPLLLVLAGGDDQLLKEFQRHFRKYEDPSTRVEAVHSLEGIDSRELVDVLVPVLEDPARPVVRAVVDVLSHVQSPEAVGRLFELLEKKRSTAIRVGILEALTEGGLPGAPAAGLALLGEKDWPVRVGAARAAAASSRPEDRSRVAALCGDPEPAVRCAALEALGAVRAPEVLEPALARLEDPSWQVRSSAIAALGSLRRREAIAPLIARMAAEEGRLVDDLGAALERITARGLGSRTEAWQRFWESFGATFEVPSDAELARLRHKQAQVRSRYDPGSGSVAYHGVETKSKRIVFVVDISASMEQEVTDLERYPLADLPDRRRIAIVKSELLRTLATFDSDVRFNLVVFATDVQKWRKELVPATPLNLSSAEDWVASLDVRGGSASEPLLQNPVVANGGYAVLDELSAGRTNTYGALMAALGVDPERPMIGDYQVDVDTLFFLSDGRPTHGAYVDATDILREVAEANRLRHVVIHTIGIGEFQRELMTRLALENGGQYVDLGG